MIRRTSIALLAVAIIGVSACGSSAKTSSTSATTPVGASTPATTPITIGDTTPITTGNTNPADTITVTAPSTPGTATPDTATPETATPGTETDVTTGNSDDNDPSALIGATWVPTSFITVGPLDTIPATLGATVVFGDDGKVSINTGCNTGSASYTLSGSQITIGPIALTKKACTDDVMQLESKITGLLEMPSYWSVYDNSLTIYPDNVTDTGIRFAVSS